MAPDEHDPHLETDHIGELIAASARTLEAPQRLRTRIDEERWRASEPAVARRLGGRRRLAALSGAAVALVAALALVLAGLPGGAGGGPSLDAAAALALATPTDPAPAVDSAHGHLVRARESGITFPNYAYELPAWRATGARRDRIHGRHATTITYRGPNGTVGYTIVAGTPLTVPAGARTVHARGTTLSVLRHGGATIVTWQRDGHTCVLASRSAGAGEMVRLATWV